MWFIIGEFQSTKIANGVYSTLPMTSASTSTGNLSSLPGNVDSSSDAVAGQHSEMFLLVTICAVAVALVVVIALVWIAVKGRRRRPTESDEERSVQRRQCIFIFVTVAFLPLIEAALFIAPSVRPFFCVYPKVNRE